MRIVITCDVLGEENNGTSIAAMNLIRSLEGKGHEVRILCCDQKRKGVKGYFVVPQRSFGIFNGYVEKNGVALAKPDYSIIKEALNGADIVHVMQPFSLGNCTARMAKKIGIPVSGGFHTQAENFTCHVFLMNNKFANKLTYHYFYKKLYSICDCIHYPSKFIKDTFEEIVGKTNGYVISNGVNKNFVRKKTSKPERFKGKFVILFTGRYSKEKSHKVLIDAVRHSRHSEEIQLIFAGDGPCKKELITYSVRHLKVQPVFKLFSREEMINTINFADLYVHPAEIEIEGIACLEAISCGLVPVIANSKRCATKFFAIDKKNLFENQNANDLADKIDYWLEHPKEKDSCSEQYMVYANKFDQEKCMRDMERMFLDTILAAQKKEKAVRELVN